MVWINFQENSKTVIQPIILQAVRVKTPRYKALAYPIAHFCQYFLQHARICEYHNCHNLTGVVYTRYMALYR